MNVAESPARVRGVFFDLDGTLADTVAALTATLNEIFSRRGYPLVTEADTLRCINYGARELVRRASPATCTDLEIDELFDEYLECYRAHNLDTRRAYDGIVELIAELRSRGVYCAVVTNKPHPMACELVESLLGGALDAA